MSDTTKRVDKELYQKITDICFENGSVTKPMVDQLYALFAKQLEEAEIRGAEGLYKYARSHHFGGPLEPTPGAWFERMKTQYVTTLPKGGTDDPRER